MPCARWRFLLKNVAHFKAKRRVHRKQKSARFCDFVGFSYVLCGKAMIFVAAKTLRRAKKMILSAGKKIILRKP